MCFVQVFQIVGIYVPSVSQVEKCIFLKEEVFIFVPMLL